MLIDTHAHINDEKFLGQEAEIVARATQRGVEKIICSGDDIETSKQAVRLAQTFPQVYASIGVHPIYADDFSQETLRELKILAKSPKVVAIGEIGLDYHQLQDDIDKTKQKETQKEVFKKQLALAHELGLPFVIHTRDAFADTLEILKTASRPLMGTLHCFGEGVEEAKEALSLGLHISVGGIVTFKNAQKLQEVVRIIGLEKLLLETDCPYLAPQGHRGERNEPSFVPIIAQKIAEILGTTLGEVSQKTSENACNLFKLGGDL